MRILTLALFLTVAAVPVEAVATPPPQSAELVAIAVQEPALPQLDAIVVVAQAETAQPTTIGEAADSVAARDEGRSKLFWILIAAAVITAGFFLYRYITREPEPVEASPRATSGFDPPDPGERRPKNRKSE